MAKRENEMSADNEMRSILKSLEAEIPYTDDTADTLELVFEAVMLLKAFYTKKLLFSKELELDKNHLKIIRGKVAALERAHFALHKIRKEE